MKCGAKYIGPWSGDTYVCGLKGLHLYHRGYCDDGTLMEWPNSEEFCANSFPNTRDFCKRPPEHRGLCRVKVHGRTINYK